MREGKPELYFLLILYQKFFDLSNPNFSIIVNVWCPYLRESRYGGRYVAAFSGKSRYGERPLDAQEKLRIALGCGNSVRGVRPRPAKNPHLLVYHISVNLSIPKIKKKKRTLVLFIIVFARGGPVGVCDTGPINPAITFSALHFFPLL